MPTETRFRVFRVDTQAATDTEEQLNEFASSDAVAAIVDWEAVNAARARQANMVIEYRPTEEA